jgi:leader peptidase (prepilin peptidase)/N-methyltransferase
MAPLLPSPIAWALVVGAGACVGSFLNVCIHRLPARRSVVRPGSACPACGAPIPWHDNVPVISYLALRGRCRRCAAPISWRYPAVEAGAALLFAALYALRGPSLEFVLEAFLGSALLALVVIDARHQILPDAITLPGIAVGLLSAPLRSGPPHPGREALVGAALGFAIPWLINFLYRLWQALRGVPAVLREDGIGQGDYKLLAMIGAFLGLQRLLLTLFLGSVSGAAFALFMMRYRGYGWKSRLPLGVFLGGAALLAVFVGESWVGWYVALADLEP